MYSGFRTAEGPMIFGGSRPEFLRNETLVDIFRDTVARVPDKVALELIGQQDALSYAELDRRSSVVAAALAARGVKQGDFVGLWLRRSLDLHVALLGILKAGAAYIPFDADAPTERVASCLADCGARLIVSHRALATETAKLEIAVAPLESLVAARDDARPQGPRPEGPAYAIYTSGSTGKPKGIVVTHRNICHYLRAGNQALGFVESDIVLQQASVAFDLSLEEIFVPYLVGATLKVATAETIKETDRLPEILEREGVTVIDTVPTLLSMFERDVASLRVIVLGGEACPQGLIDRFARPGRRLLNTYGPTETTVVATWVELSPGDAVTIGRPIANHAAYVVDDRLELVGQGQIGELLVGGPGVVQGYINLPEMTGRKFIPNPFDRGSDIGCPVLYRTGDAVSIDASGRLVFHGRIDDQVKIRGYRIELGEIEMLIADEPGVRTAAVAVGKHPSAGDMLVAHVVTNGSDFDVEAAKSSLAAKVPPYMVPPMWRTHEELPRLASGKVDRKALASLPLLTEGQPGVQEAPSSVTEAHLLAAARSVFGASVIDFDADFFTDLGGHSLMAARFVSEVRKTPALSSLALRDLYSERSIRKLAAVLDARAASSPQDRNDLSFEPVPLARRFLCGMAQAVALPFIIAIVTVQWIGLLLASIFLIRDDTPLWLEILILAGVYVALNFGGKVIVVGLKWLVIGRTKPGVYPLWGSYYFRIWLMQRVVQLSVHKFFQGSPLMGIYLWLLGARIGRDAIIQDFEEGAIDLISIGPRTSVGSKVKFANVEVIGNQVHVGRIDIGTDAHIGNGCVIGHDVSIGDGADIGDLTAIAAGTKAGPYERWDGSPAIRVGMVDESTLPPHPELGKLMRVVQAIGYFITYNIGMIIGLLPIFPAFYVLYNLDNWTSEETDYIITWSWVPVLAWPSALVLVIVSMAVVVLARWMLLPRIEPGRYSIFSGFYFRKWAVGLATNSILETLNSLYATVFMRNWYRLMGTKIGRGSEISASFAGRYDLIEMGENNFIGDEAIFGDEDIRGGWMTLERLKTGDRCFFGNSAVIAGGSVIEDDALIGVKSRLPDQLHVKAGETWLGSPAMRLPTREKVAHAAVATYEPPFSMRLWRMVFEALHTSLPTAVLITTAYITADIIAEPFDEDRWGEVVALVMSAGIVIAFLLYSFSVLTKWAFMGVYKPVMKPMWSWWAMRTEAVAVFYGGLASKTLLEFLRGTPFLPWMLRPFGTKVGKGVWINSCDITEFDCTSIGDHAVLNMISCPQTHLYEDRIMKVGRIEIGRGATIGSGSTVLYDSKIGDFAQLKPLTLVMKGESIPAHSIWAGAPAQPVRLASELRESGKVPGDRIGWVAEKSAASA
jgi:non-ribosomal peptide synthetase-like protein